MEKEKDLLNMDNSENEFSNNLNLEIIELEDKVAPRNWNVYAILYPFNS